MKLKMKKKSHILSFILFSSFMLAGCSEGEQDFEKKTIRVEVTAEQSLADKTIYVSSFHAQSGIGFQQHPLYEIESFSIESTNFERSFDYDPSGNTGLVVYAWVDNDNDGINCTMDSRDDTSGAAIDESFPQTNTTFIIELTENCVGPDWFYPVE